MSEQILMQILTEMTEIKTEIKEIKADQQEMKAEIKEMKAEIKEIRADQQVMKTDIEQIKLAVLETYDTVKKIEVTQERQQRIIELLAFRSIEQEARFERIIDRAV